MRSLRALGLRARAEGLTRAGSEFRLPPWSPKTVFTVPSAGDALLPDGANPFSIFF